MTNTMPAKSIILYGGTFNPIHLGHIQPVMQAAERVHPEKLIYIPCNIPPHKVLPDVTSQHRLNMTNLALMPYNEQSKFQIDVCDFELSQSQTSYTRYTVEHFANLYPEHTLYLLIGMDSLLQFHTWHKWQEILEFAELLVMQRPNYDQTNNEIAPRILAKTQFVVTEQVDISSSEIRNFLNETVSLEKSPLSSKPESTFIPVPVLEYIKQHKLYL
ncbi:MAG: nicotinate (nicotinamide) nucleotide adenylyltransferase [Gammaproteobacteria bacterium]|nr:nicotinate (nicotinamide) nucleotide adenylyltransferase [Gammaproteobacteria bacterium]